ncbi:MAG TPA: hypothetical protein VGV13_13815 [Methylomirabilota bacterium]|jgi:hypothetical protein|nr:hypothetical protein [Methylomirabilota bacterium]
MPVADVQRRVSSREIAEWWAYFLVEHDDRQQAELRARAEAGVSEVRRQPRRRR